MGFTFPINFDRPYISRSLTEFWRRWHISLTSWFRDYLYIPLGGNKINDLSTYRNLFIVFLLCGLWHGAAWTFLMWGCFHGLFLVIERIFRRVNFNFPNIVSHGYTTIVVIWGWVLFRSESIDFAKLYYKAMLGLNDSVLLFSSEIFDLKFFIFLMIAILLSITDINNRLADVSHSGFIQNMLYLLFFICCTASLVINTYNPFIYFRF